MTLADKIIALRKKKGLSQELLAEQLNVSRQAVSRWENGSALPDASNILQLSRLFGVTADYLLHDEYENDGDVPAVQDMARGTRAEISGQIAFLVCIALSGILMLWQVIALSFYQSGVRSLVGIMLSVAVAAGYEAAWRKNGLVSEKAQVQRCRFWRAAVWMGLPAPAVLTGWQLMSLWPRSHSVLWEYAVIAALYVGGSLVLSAVIRKKLGRH